MKKYLLISLLLLATVVLKAQTPTLAELQPTGNHITWYDAATGSNVVLKTSLLVNGRHYYASQTVNGVESTARLDVTVTLVTVAAPTAGTHTPSQTQVVWNWNTVSGATGYKWSATNLYSSATDMGTAVTKTETSLTCGTSYTRYIWAYNASGCVSSVTTLTQTTSACVVLLAIGDEYGGGKVAYILQSGDNGYNALVQHGLIVALTDQSTSQIWGNTLSYDSPITSVALGQGSANTTAIINYPTANTAAAMCRNYNGGAYNDWYLPSRDELGKIYLNYAAVGMTTTNYWSSSEQSTGAGAYAYYYNFSNGWDQINYKHITYCYVRAVRSF